MYAYYYSDYGDKNNEKNYVPFFAYLSCPLQGLVLASLRYLHTSLEALEGQENAEAESEGYLLEKSVKETVMEYLEPILKFLPLNQVSAEGGEGEEAPAPAWN